MLEPDLLWPWMRTDDHPPALSVVLPLLMAATLGATLASLVTWIEGNLPAAGQ